MQCINVVQPSKLVPKNLARLAVAGPSPCQPFLRIQSTSSLRHTSLRSRLPTASTLDAPSGQTSRCDVRVLAAGAQAAARPLDREEDGEHLEDVDEDEAFHLLGTSGTPDLELDLPVPEQRYQRPLNMKETKALRTRSNTLAKEKTIQRITAGQNGLTQSFLNACSDVLGAHDLIRVKLGEGCGMERSDAARALATYLDAVVVHQIGYTITLYREQGLPRPSNCPKYQAPAQDVDVQKSQPDQQHKVAVAKKVPKNRASARAAQRVRSSQKAAKGEPKPPPEFQVL